MPIYEFECPACTNQQEELIPISEADTPVECENCKTIMIRKIGSNIAHSFFSFTLDK